MKTLLPMYRKLNTTLETLELLEALGLIDESTTLFEVRLVHYKTLSELYQVQTCDFEIPTSTGMLYLDSDNTVVETGDTPRHWEFESGEIARKFMLEYRL